MGPRLRPPRPPVSPDHNYSAPRHISMNTPSKPTLPPDRLSNSTQLDVKQDTLVKSLNNLNIPVPRLGTKRKYNKKKDSSGENKNNDKKIKLLVPEDIDNKNAKSGNKKRRKIHQWNEKCCRHGGTDFGAQKTELLTKDDVSLCSCGFEITPQDGRQSPKSLVIKRIRLPFDKLPDLCKLKIFSFLPVTDRGRAALVCSEWKRLIRHSGLWSRLDFSDFNPPLSTHNPEKPPSPWFSTVTEYERYRVKIHKYISFLQSVVPQTRSLSFSYDIHNPKDAWLKQIVSILHNSNCRSLHHLNLDWTCTPVRPPYADKYCCFFNKARVAYQRHVQRVHSFHRLLEELTRTAPKVTNIQMPFDWSERSVLLMCRWKSLRVLKFQPYNQLHLVKQEVLDALLDNLPSIQHLALGISFPLLDIIDERNMLRLSHPRIHTLDLSGCKRIYFSSLNLPALRVLHIAAKHVRKVDGTRGEQELVYPPCLYDVLRAGAPNLIQVNDHHLLSYWRNHLYEDMEQIFRDCCSCLTHSSKTRQGLV